MEPRITVSREKGKVILKIEDGDRRLTVTMDGNFAANLAAELLNAALNKN